MTPFERTAAGTFLAEHGAIRFVRSVLMYVIAIVLIGAIVAFALTVLQAGTAPSVDARPKAEEVVDGWMPAIDAANRAARLEEARQTKDGWSSALLKPESEVRDGWSSYLLREEPEVVDGWAARYLVADDD